MITMWEDYRNVTSLTSLQPLILRAFLIMCLFLVYHVEVVTTPRWWVSPLPGDDSAFLRHNLLIIFPGDKQSKTEISKLILSGQSCQFDLSKWSFISIMDQIFLEELHLKSRILKKKIIQFKVSATQRGFFSFFLSLTLLSCPLLTSCPRCPPCCCCLISECWPPPSHPTQPSPGRVSPLLHQHCRTWGLGNIWKSPLDHRRRWSHCRKDSTETAWCRPLRSLSPTEIVITQHRHYTPLHHGDWLVSETPEPAGSVIYQIYMELLELLELVELLELLTSTWYFVIKKYLNNQIVIK